MSAFLFAKIFKSAKGKKIPFLGGSLGAVVVKNNSPMELYLK